MLNSNWMCEDGSMNLRPTDISFKGPTENGYRVQPIYNCFVQPIYITELNYNENNI